MKHTLLYLIGVSCAMFGLTACTDQDDHFMADDTILSSAHGTIWENLTADGRFKQFCNLVEKADKSIINSDQTSGQLKETYAMLLNSSKAYSVWAPLDGTYNYDSLLTLTDQKLIREFVENHIALFSFAATGDVSKEVLMLNEKYKYFHNDGSDYLMAGVKISEALPCSNGFLYVTNTKIPYLQNIYEQLDKEKFSDIDSIVNYYHAFDRRSLDLNKSTQGPLKNGERTLLDSVFNESNLLWNRYYSYINREDSNYTMIVPTNAAWNKALASISKYYNYIPNIHYLTNTAANEASGRKEYDQTINAEYLKDSLMKVMLMKDLFYNNNLSLTKNHRNRLIDSIQSGLVTTIPDTCYVTSTTNSTFYGEDAINLLSNTRRQGCSNGMMLITDSLAMHPWLSWCPAVVLNTNSGTCYTNGATLSRQRVREDDINPLYEESLWSGSYLLAQPSTLQANPEIDFLIPNIRSAEYNIYGVFVPANITNVRDSLPLPNKLRVTLGYNDETGKVVQETKNEYHEFETRPDCIDTVLIATFRYPICYYGTKASPYIKLQSIVGSRDLSNYSRTFRLDRLLFIPTEYDAYLEEHKSKSSEKSSEE